MNYVDLPVLQTRRSFLRGAAMAGAGAALAGMPFAALQSRTSGTTDWPNLEKLARDYVGNGRVANIVACLGLGESEPMVVAEGRDTRGEIGRAHV